MIDWQGKSVLVLGGAGMLGIPLVQQLLNRGADVAVLDLLLRAGQEYIYWDRLPTLAKVVHADASSHGQLLMANLGDFPIVFNLAANVAGIVHNLSAPAQMFADNVGIKVGVYQAFGKLADRGMLKTQVFLDVSTVCINPSEAPIPTPEDYVDPLKGPWSPEPSNFGYGIAKLCGEFLTLHLPIQRVIIARPSNLYGEHDYFGPGCHVIPALIQRIAGGENPLKLWGGGEQTRTFVYAADAALALIELAERAPHKTICNIGVPEEVTIQETATLIAQAIGVDLAYEPDHSQPRGYYRRVPDLTRATKLDLTCVREWTRLADGIKRTVAWWQVKTGGRCG